MKMSTKRSKQNAVLVDESFASLCQEARANKEQCPFGCNKVLAPRTIDYHRLNGCRGKNEESFADSSRKRTFICGVCFDEFVTRDGFFEHLSRIHDIHPTLHTLIFASYEQFERFRHWIELRGGAHFRLKSGSKERPSGKGIFMMCNRSGLVHSIAPTGDTMRDKTGSYRTGFTCCAFINGNIHPDGHVVARLCVDHYGHDVKMRLPQSVKNIIMQKILMRETFPRIIRYLQNAFMPISYDNIFAQRVCLVDQEELRGISAQLKKWQEKGSLPYDREEEWEDDFLEKAGIIREDAPRKDRPDDWKSHDELAMEENWPKPRIFELKQRGDTMYGDEDTEGLLRVKAEIAEAEEEDAYYQEVEDGHFEGEKPTSSRHARQHRDAEFVDVVEMEELEEGEGQGEEDGDVHVESAEIVEGESGLGKRRRIAVRGEEGGSKTFLVSSIIAELDMLRAVVKDQFDFLPEADLGKFLSRVRRLRSSWEPIPVVEGPLQQTHLSVSTPIRLPRSASARLTRQRARQRGRAVQPKLEEEVERAIEAEEEIAAKALRGPHPNTHYKSYLWA